MLLPPEKEKKPLSRGEALPESYKRGIRKETKNKIIRHTNEVTIKAKNATILPTKPEDSKSSVQKYSKVQLQNLTVPNGK